MFQNAIVAMRDLVNENERMSCEISRLKLKTDDLNAELYQMKMNRDLIESEQLQLLMAENKKLVHDFKGSSIYYEDVDFDSLTHVVCC